MSVIKSLGSLTFALTLITVLIAVLVFSTFTESAYGTPFAKKAFYDTRWFDIFLSLFAVNIFCSTLTRWPFKKRHVGFVITHIGILMVLAGSLASRVWGVEGQMSLFENESDGRLMQQNFVLTATEPGGAGQRLSIETLAERTKKGSAPLFAGEGIELAAVRVLKNAEEKKVLLEGAAGLEKNHAVEATLRSGAVGLAQDFILIEHDEDDPDSRTVNAGPATISLGGEPAAPAPVPPTLRLTQLRNGRSFTVTLDEKTLKEGASIPEMGLRLTDIRYYPYAKVKNNAIIDATDEIAHNPAVEFKILDAEGRMEHHTKFALFPDFNTVRGGVAKNFFNLGVELQASFAHPPAATAGPSLIFYPTESGVWKYRITSSRSAAKEGEIKSGENIETGWMDIRLEVKKLYSHARFAREVVPAANPSGGSYAIQLLAKTAGAEKIHWLWAGRPMSIESSKGPLTLLLAPETRPLPFSLKLKDFRKVDYPGTENPMAFESDVILGDAATRFSMEKTISMNKPLDYKGYRIFQASYMQDETYGEGSVFSIAKNPGIRLIYPGAIVILIGVILLFYFHPFFNRELQ